MKKQVSLLLCFLILCQAFAGCSEKQKEGGNQNETSPAVDETETSGEEQKEETTEHDAIEELYSDLPTADYGGYKFSFLNNISNFAYTIMTAEDITGEGINDAIYNRNQKVCSDLNISIVENLESYDQVTNDIRKAISSGDETYSAFWNESYLVAPLAINGELTNVRNISSLNLDKPWWEGNVLNEITFGDYLYFLVGDIHLMLKESYWMCGFNRDMLVSLNMTDPYEQVKNGTWTIDALKAEIDGAVLDLDGNGLYDGLDQLGVTCTTNCFDPLFYGMGENYIDQAEDGSFIFKNPDDRYYSVCEKITNTIFTNAAVCLDGKTDNIAQYQAQGQDAWHGVFSSGHALFYFEPIGSLKKLRDMDAEFGIVPYPKYNEEQDGYHTLIARFAAFCGIPVSLSEENLERVGVILENLCARSYVDLKNAYVNETLNFKYIRDKESSEMMNLILSTGTIDIGNLIGVSSVQQALSGQAQTGKTDFASTVNRALKSANKLLDRNMKQLTKTEE